MKENKPEYLSPGHFFKKRKFRFTLFFLIIIALTAGAAVYTKFKPQDIFRAIPRVIAWAGENLIPIEWDKDGIRLDEKAISRIPNIMVKLTDSILMSIMASITASIFSFVLALLGSRTTQVNKFLAIVARATGFLALFFYSFGFMSRIFIETIDEASGSSVEALRAAGASYPQVIAQAVVPSSMPQMVSWMLYMIETNIRSAALVGILTGSGIGFLFSVYYSSRQYKSAALVVLCIVAVVLFIEFVSNSLRRVIL